MKTLVVYDKKGTIYYQASGDYTVPDGLQHLEIDVPDGMYIESVDPVTDTAVRAEYPKSQDEINAEAIADLQLAVAELGTLQGGARNG